MIISLCAPIAVVISTSGFQSQASSAAGTRSGVVGANNRRNHHGAQTGQPDRQQPVAHNIGDQAVGAASQVMYRPGDYSARVFPQWPVGVDLPLRSNTQLNE